MKNVPSKMSGNFVRIFVLDLLCRVRKDVDVFFRHDVVLGQVISLNADRRFYYAQ